MRYIYLNPKGEEEEFNDPCEKLKQNLIDQGYIFIKHIDRFGNEYSAERGRRARLTQDPMCEVREYLECKNQLSMWGIQ